MRKNMPEAMVWRIEPVIAKARIAYWLKLENSQVGILCKLFPKRLLPETVPRFRQISRYDLLPLTRV